VEIELSDEEIVISHTLNMAIPIFEAIYGKYFQALFLFDNAISHSIFGSNALQVQHMNLEPGRKQLHLRDDGSRR
jgi:hypothetical protein